LSGWLRHCTVTYMVFNTLGLIRSCGTSKMQVRRLQEFRVPTWYLVENKEVPDRNIVTLDAILSKFAFSLHVM
jgi:hypothetical protein